jgi:manganese oxidase
MQATSRQVSRYGVAALAIGLFAAGSVLMRNPAVPPDPLAIALNDMNAGGGREVEGALVISLEARSGEWRPDGADGLMRRVAAFGEADGPMQIPGPMLRVRVGTVVRATVRNTLDEPLMMYGLGAERALASDSVLIAPGDLHEFTFTARDAGVFYYAGRTTPVPALLIRSQYDSQLNGAIVVDPADAPAVPGDRIFMLTQWFSLDSTTVSGIAPNPVLAINGRVWPHTETLDVEQGDSLHWRLINVTQLPHPMHLHGFYFSVDALGDDAAYRLLPADERYLAVTELMLPGTTLALSWSPERPGNWIFHCHFAGHISGDGALNKDRRHPTAVAATHADHATAAGASPGAAGGASNGTAAAAHAEHGMSGLVLGIRVRPRGEQVAEAGNARPIRLLLRSRPDGWGGYAAYGYALGGSSEEADPQHFTIPGPMLVLQRGEPVAITLVNQSHEGGAVHWHGIELPSYPDGVPGWSGQDARVLPVIAPGDSITVHFTPPRAGTFMYHSHFNEFQQIGSGMHASIIVLEPGQSYDPETDRVMLFSEGGPWVNLITGPFPPITLNGTDRPSAMQLNAGVTYRFRLINILAEGVVAVSLLQDDRPAEWRLVARDGAALPPALARTVPAELTFGSGTIHDVEFTPRRPGRFTLRYHLAEDVSGLPVDMVVNVR